MQTQEVYDYVIIGSGFGGSVSAMRLAEKGYQVLVLERGKRFRDQDFAKSNWQFWKYLWGPGIRCFGVLQISPFKDVFVLHGSGVGGGSLGYATVLLQPTEATFAEPGWQVPLRWGDVLRPYYALSRCMLGVTTNPRLWPADHLLREIAEEMGQAHTFLPTEVGIFFGEPGKEGQEVPDPYFGGQGPARNGCKQCGGCMVGCRYNAKNTLVKNYLYFAEAWGVEVRPECLVEDIRPLAGGQQDGARYEISYRSSTAWFFKPEHRLRARNVIVSAGALGTLRLLFRCRDMTGSLPQISPRLGDQVRTNSESLTGVVARNKEIDFSEGIAITSAFQADPVTTVEPCRYPRGSSLMRLLSGPFIEDDDPAWVRIAKTLVEILRHPLDFLQTHVLADWAQRATILLVMQNVDNRVKMRQGRNIFTLFKRNLVSQPEHEFAKRIPSKLPVAHQVTRAMAAKIGAVPAGSINESLLNTSMTAHIMGGCPMGEDAQQGVIGQDFQVHNYPGLYVLDGSIIPANPGVNPGLTITAMTEYALSLIPPRPGAPIRPVLGMEAASPPTEG